jgi:flagellar basal-body rod protein FlgF
MDNTLMIALTNQRLLRDRMDIVANNMANVSTTGFKVEAPLSRELAEKPALATDQPHDIRFVEAFALQRDMRQGPMARTGNALDLAIEGEGFFSVRQGQGTAYTRDGRFTPNDAGVLVDREGRAVLDDAGGEITLNPQGGPVEISPGGLIRQGGAEVARLAIVSFPTPGALEKLGDNLWGVSDEQPQPMDTPTVRQGMLEGSNVNAVLELTRMMEISRAYENATRVVRNTDELRSRAIDRLGRVGG